MNSFVAALKSFYDGELIGEAVYSGLLEAAQTPDERLKWSTLLQLETETKAWLRAPMIAAGVSIVESSDKRQYGTNLAEQFKPASWSQKMEGLRDSINNEFVPQYQVFADAARSRGQAAEEAICVFMVDHEKAQVEFARRELAGASMEYSLEPIVQFLKYPLKPK